MSSGGGKGGKKETETTIPDWVRGPAERNLRRAEQVQQLKYMPYTGPQVAAFNETQNAAMNNNIAAAKAFGLLDPNSTLTATTGTPTPTEYAGGFRGYGSIGLYDQALAELTARDPANMAAYNSLFGNAIPANNFGRGGGGGGGGGNITHNPPSNRPRLPSDYNAAKWGADRVLTETSKGGKGGRGDIGGNRDLRSNFKRRSLINRRKAITSARGERNKRFGGNY